MLYLFHGTDVEKTRAKAFAWVAAARAKEPNLAYVRLAREELTPAALEDASHSGGLFVQRLLVLLDDPFPAPRTSQDDETDAEETSTRLLDDQLAMLAASDNAIILLAPKLASAKVKTIAAKAKLVYVFDKPLSSEKKRGFNSALVDALGARSREKLWLEMNRAIAEGDAPEMLHGLLHWKARDLMMKGSRVWSTSEARALSLTLIELLQQSRRGGLALPLALEKFALEM